MTAKKDSKKAAAAKPAKPAKTSAAGKIVKSAKPAAAKKIVKSAKPAAAKKIVKSAKPAAAKKVVKAAKPAAAKKIVKPAKPAAAKKIVKAAKATTAKKIVRPAAAAKPAKPPNPASPAGRPTAPATNEAPLYAFMLELLRVRPKVWRAFYLPSDVTLKELSRAIQRHMGWDGWHVWRLNICGQGYMERDVTGGLGFDGELDAAKVRLRDLGLGAGSVFSYEYDFGDGWGHRLTLVDDDYRPDSPGSRSGILDGARACPPDDCGGPWGYRRMLEALADTDDPDHERMVEWAGEDFDPEFYLFSRGPRPRKGRGGPSKPRKS
jgi:hypothetical protein